MGIKAGGQMIQTNRARDKHQAPPPITWLLVHSLSLRGKIPSLSKDPLPGRGGRKEMVGGKCHLWHLCLSQETDWDESTSSIS